jgi:hypothetical protein
MSARRISRFRESFTSCPARQCSTRGSMTTERSSLHTARLYRFGEYLIAVAAERINVDTANFNGPKSAAAVSSEGRMVAGQKLRTRTHLT